MGKPQVLTNDSPTANIFFETRISQIVLTPEGVEIKLAKSKISVQGVAFLDELQRLNEPVKVEIKNIQNQLI